MPVCLCASVDVVHCCQEYFSNVHSLDLQLLVGETETFLHLPSSRRHGCVDRYRTLRWRDSNSSERIATWNFQARRRMGDFYVNSGWCSDVTVIQQYCSRDLESFFINGKPFCSPCEFTSFILLGLHSTASQCAGGTEYAR